MSEDEKKLSRFLKSIDRFAKNHKSEVLSEIKKIEKEQLEKSENEIIDDVRTIIQKELIITKNKVLSQVSSKNLENKKIIADLKNKIIEDLFKNCENYLVDFTNKEEYSIFFEKSAEKIREKTKKNIEIFIRSEDLRFDNILQEIFSSNCKVLIDNNIKIGGLWAKSDNIIFDETIDSKLKDNKKNFSINI